MPNAEKGRGYGASDKVSFLRQLPLLSEPKWILPKMCFPKWLLLLPIQLVNFQWMSAFAAKLFWKAL